jgi:hypothetical protein
MLDTFRSEFKSNPENILVGIGPSIGPDHYEVGSDVIREVKAKFGVDTPHILHEKENGKAFLDLWKANRIQLEREGIPSENIEDSHLCTYRDHEFFFSARQSGTDCGRFGTGIMIRE